MSTIKANTITAATTNGNINIAANGTGKVLLNGQRLESSAEAADLAATALSYALATNDATSITGAVGAFYLSDDFESDSLATKTNATYDATYDYYHAPYALQEDDQNECTSTTGFSGTSLSAVTVDGRSAIKSAHPGNGSGISMYSPALTPGSQTTIVWEFAAKWILRNGTDNNRQGWEIKVPGLSKWINSSTSTYQQPSSNTWYTYKVVYDTVADEVDMYLDGVQKWTAVPASTSGDASTSSGGLKLSNSVDNGNTGVYNDMYLDRVAIGYEASPNMTLAPTAASLTTANPTDLTAYVTFEPVDSVTAGTDIVMTASIDGGTTDATGTWTLVGNIGASNKLYRVDFDVSAQTGSSLIYEITTANNKNLRVHNVIGIRALY